MILSYSRNIKLSHSLLLSLLSFAHFPLLYILVYVSSVYCESQKVKEMEMKGIIEHSILREDAEIYRGRARYREGGNIKGIQSE